MGQNYTYIHKLTDISENDISCTEFFISKYINNGRYLTYKYPLSVFIKLFQNIIIDPNYPISTLYKLSNDLTQQNENLINISNLTENNTNFIESISSILSNTLSDGLSEYNKFNNIKLSTQELQNELTKFDNIFLNAQTLININNNNLINNNTIISTITTYSDLITDLSNKITDESVHYIELSTSISTDISKNYNILNSCSSINTYIDKIKSDFDKNKKTQIDLVKTLSNNVLLEKTKNKLYTNKFCNLTFKYTSDVVLMNDTDSNKQKTIDFTVIASLGYTAKFINVKIQQYVQLSAIDPTNTTNNKIWIEAPNSNNNNTGTLLSANITYSNLVYDGDDYKIKLRFSINQNYKNTEKNADGSTGIRVRAKIVTYEQKI